MEHIKEDAAAVKNIFQKLNLYGLALFIVPMSDKDETAEYDKPDNSGHYRMYGKADFIKLLTNSEFSEVVPIQVTGHNISNEILFVAKKFRKS